MTPAAGTSVAVTTGTPATMTQMAVKITVRTAAVVKVIAKANKEAISQTTKSVMS